MATPSTPIPRKVTEVRSSATFSIDEKTRKPKGVLESPIALKTAARILYMKRKGRPRK